MSLAHGLYRERGKKLFLLDITVCEFPTLPQPTKHREVRTQTVLFLSVGTQHGEGEPQSTDNEALLKLLCNKK